MDDNRKRALAAALSQIEKQFGKGTVMRMGDKVGTMGSRTIGRAVASAAGASRPTLYIEMRNKSTPIDPSGWWASPDKPTESG